MEPLKAPNDLNVDPDFPVMAVVYIAIQLLNQNPRRTRRHALAKIRKLAKFMSVSRIICPLLVDKDYTVIAGHARLEAAKLLGLTSVPVIMIEHLDEAMLRAFALADNQFAINAGWDEKAVREELVFLSDVVLNYGLEITDLGFPTAEIDLRIGDQTLLGPEDDIIAPETKTPAITSPGDVWILGRHRLICGDSRDRQAYVPLMRGEVAVLIFTDAPFNISVKNVVGGLGRIKHEEFAMASGEMTPEQFMGFLAAVMALMREFSAEGSIHFQCMDWRHVYEMEAAARQVGYELKNICVWVKDNGGMGSLYAYLVDVYRMRLDFPSLIKKIHEILKTYGQFTRCLLIEENGLGLQLIQQLRYEGVRAIGIRPQGDKAERFESVTAMFQSGQVLFPKDEPWLADLEHELLSFPSGRYDDQVDSISQFLIWHQRSWNMRPRSGSF